MTTLFHFTPANKLRSIKRRGLVPQQGDHMTNGHKRVWLTAQPNVSLTDKEAEWLADHGGARPYMEENGRLRFGPPRTWLYNDCRASGGLFGKGLTFTLTKGEPLVRLTVRLRKNDPHLHRWAKWRGRPRGRSHDFADLRRLPYARLWYVYDDIIQPDRIVEIAAAA
jgi:hypothetical protein